MFVFSILAASMASRADPEQGLQLALRTGFTLPFGRIIGGSWEQKPGGALGDSFAGFFPMGAEAGWRIDRNLFVGAVFQYAFGLARQSARYCAQGSYNCSGSDIFLGVEGIYHFMPKNGRDPWAGIGAGYEWLGSSRSSGAYSETLYDKGVQLNLQVGVDFPVAQSFFVAPFLTFAVGEYTTLSSRLGPGGYAEDITYSSLHELLTIGLRVSFNL
jgi:hypothetical protein